MNLRNKFLRMNLKNKLIKNSFCSFSQNSKFDVVVIGSGPGGYVAAIKASQLGLKVACVEKRATLGGTCLNIGCIPSKALLNASHLYHNTKNNLSKYGIKVSNCEIDLEKMQKSKENSVKSLTNGIEMLFRKNKVEWIKGTATLKTHNLIEVSSNEKQNSSNKKTISAKNVILATGSDVKHLPGLNIDEENILSSTGALKLKKVPEKLAVIGAGVIGLEMGSVWNRLGSKVTVIEYLNRIAPGMDTEVANSFTKIMKKQGIDFKFGFSVKKASFDGKKTKLTMKSNKSDTENTFECDKLLVAVGRKAYFDGIGVEKLGIKTNKGIIQTDEKFRTNIKNIYAIGDIIKGPQLAHKAEEEGIAVAEIIANKTVHINYNAIPNVVYTSPEVASVGKTEEQLKNEGIKYKKGVFPFLANSRAKTVDEYEGFVKTLCDADDGKLLGVHIIGEQAGELIQEACLVINYGGSAEDIVRTSHAHPTRSEALKESAMAAIHKPIHF